jgi:ERCC4-related helicase
MFLVPTRILVEQQYNVLQKYFPTLKIKSLVGNASGQPDLAIINEADICVTTPQMFL